MAGKGNVYNTGARAGRQALNAFGNMTTMSPISRLGSTDAYRSINNMSNITNGTNMMDGQGGQLVSALDPTLTAGRDMVAGSGNTSDYMSTYMNPFTNQVIDRSMTDMARTNDIMQDQNNAAAAAAGAFGGSRHGLTAATVASDLVRNQGDLAAGLRNQGFNTAANLAQGHVAQNVQRGNTLANIDQMNFNNNMMRAGQLSELQSMDVQNRFRDQDNQFRRDQAMLDTRQQDIDNRFRRNQQNNTTRLARGNAFADSARELYAAGDRSVALQQQAGQQALDANQQVLDAASMIFDSNNPMQALQALQAALTGNPLMGESIQQNERKPGSLEIIGGLLGGGGGLLGGK